MKLNYPNPISNKLGKFRRNLNLRLFKNVPFKLSDLYETLSHFHRAVFELGTIVAIVFIALYIHSFMVPINYQLTKSIAHLIGSPASALVNRGLTYDSTSKTYYLNKSAITNALSKPNSVTVGTQSNAYSLKIPRDLTKGVTYYDNVSKLSFTLAPQFKTIKPKNNNGQFIYPIGNGNIQAVYTIKQNGLKEDIVLNKEVANSLSFSYKLSLPSYLTAKAMPSGSIGIYSADPSLFSNISSASARLLAEKASASSPKNHLVFALMAPSITESYKTNGVPGKVKLSIRNNVVTLVASNLNKLHYPLTIDPSVVVASASTFGNSGNNESDLNLIPSSGQISTAGLTGGVLANSWPATTSLLAATSNLNSVAYNGYIYEMAGYTTAYTGNVSYAPINTNGSIGAWTYTSTLPAAFAYADTVAYNGYIYEIGGAQGTTAYANVYYALICNGSNSGVLGCSSTPGSLGTWTTTTSLPTINAYATAAAYNGYMYEIGGCGTVCGSASIATVDYAVINADGTLGAWTATTSLPVATHAAGVSAVAYNGYLYYIGGETGTTTLVATVYYIAIITNGTLGSAWASGSSLPVATDYATNVVSNGYLYMIGGDTGSVTASVYYASINSNGSLGSWLAVTSLPAATYVSGSVAYNGYVYEVGGYTTTYVSTVDYIPIEPAGYIGSWPATTTFPAVTSKGKSYYPINATSVVYNGYVYEIGGVVNSAATATVDYAPINANGTIGAWTATTSLPATTEYATSVVYNGYVYEIGGYTTAVTGNVSYAPINANGTLGTWTFTTSLPAATEYATSVVYNGYVYEIAGYTGTVSTGAVDYALINNGGPGFLNTWAASGNSLLSATYMSSSADYTLASNGQNTYFWQIGGYTTAPTATVTYNRPTQTIGNSTPPATTTSLPVATYQATSAAYNGYVYEIGGNTGSPTANTYYNLICTGTNSGASGCSTTTGTLGTAWTATTSLPVALDQATSVVYNDYVYEIGGYNGTSAVNTVYYAALNTNGTIGSWSSSNNLPVATYQATSAAYNGYVYEIGGYNGSSNVSTVYYAPINSGGATDIWNTTTSLPSAVDQAISIAFNGFIYELGGYTTAATSAVDYVGLASIPRIGIYSALVDITGYSNSDPNPIGIISNGTNVGNQTGFDDKGGGGGITVQYQFASNACTTFNSRLALSTGINSPLGSPYRFTFTSDGCATNTNLARYVFIRYILDDSGTASFPDIYGNHTSISNFTLYYHPATNYRLRGGATFSNGGLQSLDAPPL